MPDRPPVPKRDGYSLGRSGFTLIELLVVISIISLLVAILLPALSSARASARAMACSSMMRQMAIGVVMYTDEHDGKFFAGRTSDYSKFWPDFISRYVTPPRDSAGYRCTEVDAATAPWRKTGYGYNANLQKRAVRVDAITEPYSVIPVFWEDTNESTNYYGGWPDQQSSPWGGSWVRLEFLHPGETQNVALLDTHVEVLRKDAAPASTLNPLGRPTAVSYKQFVWNVIPW